MKYYIKISPVNAETHLLQINIFDVQLDFWIVTLKLINRCYFSCF